jgi:hypothetical protein
LLSFNEIIAYWYKHPKVDECIRLQEPKHLQEDLKQEVFVILMGTDQSKVTALHESGDMIYYIVRIVLNTIQSNTSPFFKKYRNPNEISIGDGLSLR